MVPEEADYKSFDHMKFCYLPSSITNYEKDRIEMESSEFHNQVINGYRRLAKEEKRFFRIDANQNKEYIADQIFNFLKR